MNKRITVTVGVDGQTTVEAHGFKGKGCVDATQEIERALGTPGPRQKKKEYEQAAVISQQI